MTQSYPILEITGAFDDGAETTAIFEMESASVTAGQLTEFLAQFGGGGGVVGAITAQLPGQQGSQISIDGGAGPRSWEIQWEGWTNSDDFQWGDDSSPGLSKTSATGEDRISQVEVLNEWIARINLGSGSPATLYYGEHSEATAFADGGVYDPVSVTVQDVELSVSKDEAAVYQGSMTCVSVIDITQIIDGQARTG